MKLFKRSKAKNPSNRLHVLIEATGGIGDFVSTLCFIETFYKEMGGPIIDLLIKDYRRNPLLGLFSNEKPPYINKIIGELEIEWAKRSRKIIKSYHLHVTVKTSLVKYSLIDKPFIARYAPDFFTLYARYYDIFDDLAPLYNAAPRADYQVAVMANFLNLNRKGFMGYAGCLPIKNDSYTTLFVNPEKINFLKNLRLEPKKYITIHSGYDSSYTHKNNSKSFSTKNWQHEKFKSLIKKIKSAYPDLEIVNITSTNSNKIENADINFQGDLELVTILLKYSLCHIDGESGLVRVARELNTKSIVIFGPTNYDYFKLDENINLKPSACGNCFQLHKVWLDECIKGYSTPACTDSISVDQVFSAFKNIYPKLNKKLSLNISEIHLYGEKSSVKDDKYIEKIFKAADLEPVPITQHSKNDSEGTYIHASKQWEYVCVSEQIDKYAEENSEKLKIADVGGGRGAIASYLGSRGFELDQYDINFMHATANHEVEANYFKFSKHKHFSVKYGSIFNVPCPSETYDVVTCISVVEHVPEKLCAFEELLRILKPGGILIVTFDLSHKLDHEKAGRVEVFNLESLEYVLKSLGIQFKSSILTERLAESAKIIQIDRVRGIPDGMTVGSLTIQKIPVKDEISVEPSNSLSEALASRS